MKIGFISPCKLVKVEYDLRINGSACLAEIIYLEVSTRPTKRHNYVLRYHAANWIRQPTNDLSRMPQTERAALAELPFNENGPTSEIKAKILEAIKQQLTIV